MVVTGRPSQERWSIVINPGTKVWQHAGNVMHLCEIVGTHLSYIALLCTAPSCIALLNPDYFRSCAVWIWMELKTCEWPCCNQTLSRNSSVTFWAYEIVLCSNSSQLKLKSSQVELEINLLDEPKIFEGLNTGTIRNGSSRLARSQLSPRSSFKSRKSYFHHPVSVAQVPFRHVGLSGCSISVVIDQPPTC
jgi:hypothetical protein